MGRSSTIELARARPRSARSMTAVGYCRRSTDRQEQSIPDQQKAIENYAAEHKLKLLRFYVDDAISGTSTVGRKAFQQLIEDAKKPSCEFGVVLVYDVKRFGRIDNDEAGHYRYILKTHGVEVMYCSENFKGDRTDDLLRPVKQWQAREESKDLSKVTIRGLLSKAGVNRNGSQSSGSDGAGRGAGARRSGGEGWWMGGAPPFGYDLAYQSSAGEFLFYLRYLCDGTKQMFDQSWNRVRTLARRESIAVSRKDRCKLVPGEPDRVKVVQRIFKLYVGGRGFKSIVDLLNRDGVPPPRGPEWSHRYGGVWTLSSVRSILINPIYGGDMVWNRRTDARFHRIVKGEAVERKGIHCRRMEWNDEQDWIVVPNAHKPLVKRRVWEQARQLLRSKPESEAQRGINQRTGAVVDLAAQPQRNGVHWQGPRAKFLLSGLITCPRCGSRYEGRIDYGARPRDERHQRKRRHVYGCGGYIRHGKSHCSLGPVRQDVLENAVIQALIEFYSRYTGADGRQRMVDALNLRVGATEQEIKAKRKALDVKLKKTETTLRRLLDNITTANRDLVDRRVVELRREHAQVEQEIAGLGFAEVTSADFEEAMDEAARFIAGLGSSLREGPMDQRQAAVRRCVAQIKVDAESHRAELDVRVVPKVIDDNCVDARETLTISWQS
ncbi:MAG: recombinase family protein [Phycisphaerales bacterium]|nr:recombinase family protein [Phycisphaerales bacterium]MCI0629298.1 recombinase family protein [Phycisphaerales bacterium]MCI0676361.1 recombinase family protein [Phycisphaerales bacterium]